MIISNCKCNKFRIKAQSSYKHIKQVCNRYVYGIWILYIIDMLLVLVPR